MKRDCPFVGLLIAMVGPVLGLLAMILIAVTVVLARH